MSGGTESAFAQRALAWALRLYPKHYRDQQESEIAGTYTAATAGAGRAETLREALDVARHGLRVRLRLTFDQYGGAVVVAALPYVLGSLLGLSAFMSFMTFRPGVSDHHEYFFVYAIVRGGIGGRVLYYAPVCVLAPAIGIALTALAGLWSWTRRLAVLTLAAAVAVIAVVFELRGGDHIYVLTTFPGFEMPLMLAAFAAMVLAVPPEVRSLAGQRIPTIVVALAVTGMLQLAWQREGFAWSLITAVPGVVAVVLVIASAFGLRDSLVPGAVALACAPWLIQPLTGDLFDYGYNGTQYVLLVALAIVLVLAVGGRRHRSRMSTE